MTTGERVKEIRKSANLTLEEFGSRIGLKNAAVSLIENNKRALTDTVAKSISREFGVSEDWLRTGGGNKKSVTSTSTAAGIAEVLGLGEWGTAILEQYMALSPEERKLFLATVRKLLSSIIPAERTMEIEEKVASYRAELEAQATSEKSSVSQTGSEKEA